MDKEAMINEIKEAIYKEAAFTPSVVSALTHVGVGAATGAGTGYLLGRRQNKQIEEYNKTHKSKVKKINLAKPTIGMGITGGMIGGEVYGIRKNLHDIKHMNDDWQKNYDDFWKNYQRYQGYSGAASHASDSVNFDKAKDLFGVNFKDMKNKSEVEKAYKAAARKYHPDLNKAPEAAEKMKSINSMMDNIRKSQWFQKLATDQEYILEKIAEYMDMIYESAIEKTASSKEHDDKVKKLIKPEISYNTQPTPKTFGERLRQKENFKENKS
jgi:hypothetical protein